MKKWYIKNKNIDYNEISRKFHISSFLAKLIVNRDVTDDELIESFLNPSVELLHTAKEMKDVENAAKIIKEKIYEKKRIRVIGDYDVDGVISTFLLYTALKRVGALVDYDIPDRIKDGYGINIDIINRAKEQGVDTLITCDNGIAAINEIEHAVSMGMTVIVTDHHDIPFVEEESGRRSFIVPKAQCVVNPKQEDCPYKFKKICGAAVAYKFIEVLYDEFLIPKEETMKFMEFVAIATVCDVVDLIDENRIFVKEGLKMLNNTENIGLKALIKINNIADKTLSAYHLGFVIGPCINASGRLDNAKRGIELLLSKDEETANRLAKELYDLNSERKDMTEDGVEKAIEVIEKNNYKDQSVFVIYVPDIHESLAGIVAGRVREKYNVPSIIITKAEEGAKGSGRSIEGYNMFEELLKCKDLLTRFGGHPMAAGLSITEENIDLLRERLNAMSPLTKDDLVPKIYLDMQLPIKTISYEIIDALHSLEPFGKANPKPLFGEKGLKAIRANILGKNKNVLKIQFLSKEGLLVEGIYFGDIVEFENTMMMKYGENELKNLYEGHKNNIYIDIVFYPEVNQFNGNTSIQLVIEDFR